MLVMCSSKKVAMWVFHFMWLTNTFCGASIMKCVNSKASQICRWNFFLVMHYVFARFLSFISNQKFSYVAKLCRHSHIWIADLSEGGTKGNQEMLHGWMLVSSGGRWPHTDLILFSPCASASITITRGPLFTLLRLSTTLNTSGTKTSKNSLHVPSAQNMGSFKGRLFSLSMGSRSHALSNVPPQPLMLEDLDLSFKRCSTKLHDQ